MLPPLQIELLPPVILQAGLGLTVIVKLHVDELPHASKAVLVTVVIPIGKVLPDAGLEMIMTAPQLSVAVTLKSTTLLHAPLLIFDGHVITGAWVSLI